MNKKLNIVKESKGAVLFIKIFLNNIGKSFVFVQLV